MNEYKNLFMQGRQSVIAHLDVTLWSSFINVFHHIVFASDIAMNLEGHGAFNGLLQVKCLVRGTGY